MAVIAEYKIGNTTIKINDEYMVTDKEEIDRILERIGDIYINAYLNGRTKLNKNEEVN